MRKQSFSTLNHCVFRLTYHLVLVTKYRKRVISKEMLVRLQTIFDQTLKKWECRLIEFNGEPDHVHFIIETPPMIQISKLANNLKTVSSRLIRRDFREEVSRSYWKPVFWSRSYAVFSTGGVSIDVLRKYVEDQNGCEPDE